MELILASGSPRRRELLEQVGLTDFTVCPADIDEVVEPGLSPQETVLSLSRQKAQAVWEAHPRALVLAADTVVCLDGRVLGKPRDQLDAVRMLRALSGRSHQVYTGFTLLREDRWEADCEETTVTFRDLFDDEIAAYVATGEPMDKAGGYGIQGKGALLVRGIQGDHYNVVGLPLCRLCTALKSFGIELMAGRKG